MRELKENNNKADTGSLESLETTPKSIFEPEDLKFPTIPPTSTPKPKTTPSTTTLEKTDSPFEITLHPEENDTELDEEVAMLNKKLLEDGNEENNNNHIQKTTPNTNNNTTNNTTKDNKVKSKVVKIESFRTRKEEPRPERRHYQQ